MKTRFIFNPRSGRNARRPGLLEITRRHITEQRLDASIVLTEHPRHANSLAHRAVEEGCELVVAVGGDGTMNEVAAALVQTPAIFGLIPYGSGNGLARHLGIPLSIPGALQNLRTGAPRLIDSGVIDGHAFFCVAGLGFEARIAHAFGAHVSRGFTGYLSLTARSFWRHRAERYQVRMEQGTPVTLEAFTLAIANTDQYGNNAIIAPGARADDGLLNLTAIPALNPLNAPFLACRLFQGTIDREKGVTHLQARQFGIERAAPGLIHTDGEIHQAGTSLEVRILPASLRIMAPPAPGGLRLGEVAAHPLGAAAKT